MRYVQNDEYVDPMATLGALVHGRVIRFVDSVFISRLLTHIHRTSGLRPASSYQAYRSFIRIWRQLGLYELTSKYFATRRQQHIAHQTIHSSTRGVFRKSKKKLDEDTPIGIDFSTYEYAVERKVLECPVLELSYYVDVVGEVPPLPHHEQFSRSDVIDIGNGDTPPEWGLDLVIHGGFLKYGPWADRQRVELQRAFFPPAYQNAELSPRLKPGDKRMWTALQVFVELRDLTTLSIPFREASKARTFCCIFCFSIQINPSFTGLDMGRESARFAKTPETRTRLYKCCGGRSFLHQLYHANGGRFCWIRVNS